jgi:hypothetical protein
MRQTTMTKQDWKNEVEQLWAACRSFQDAWSMDEGDEAPDPSDDEMIGDIWNHCESIGIWAGSERMKAWIEAKKP